MGVLLAGTQRAQFRLRRRLRHMVSNRTIRRTTPVQSRAELQTEPVGPWLD